MSAALTSGIAPAAALVTSCIFLASALLKLRAPGVFVENVAEYRLVPHRTTRAVAWIVIAAEFATAISLSVPSARLAGSVVGGSLALVFAVAMLRVMSQGRQISCGCFGVRGTLDSVGASSVVRALVVGAFAAVGALATGWGSVESLAVAPLLFVLLLLTAELARLVESIRKTTRVVGVAHPLIAIRPDNLEEVRL